MERWLAGNRSVVLRRGRMVVKIILSGHLGLDREEALAWLTDLVTEQLAGRARRRGPVRGRVDAHA